MVSVRLICVKYLDMQALKTVENLPDCFYTMGNNNNNNNFIETRLQGTIGKL